MEVKESDVVVQAINNIDRYLNRGGDLKGDEPQLLEGTSLLNTIGVAMGLPFRDPEDWSKHELMRALNNELVYFIGDARKAIDVIADQIKYCCNGDEKIYITVLPIQLYFEGKLYELPLFRVHRYKNSKKFYVDNVGRSYDSCSDWIYNNKLPPCKMIYPQSLTLKLRPGYNYSEAVMDYTPSAKAGSQVVKGVDIATSIAGIGSSVGLLFLTGGLATPLVVTGVASAIWGTSRTGYHLIDRASHGESINPFDNSESRMMWLGIAANIVSFGAMGASMRLMSLAVRGRDISNSFMILVNVMNGTNIVVSGFAMLNATVFLIEHYDQMSSIDVLMHVASMAFWTKGLYTYKTAATLIKNAQDQTFKILSKPLEPEDAKKLSFFRKEFNNDAQLLREFHRASEANISIQTFSKIIFDSASIYGDVKFDGTGNLIFTGGQKYSLEFLSKLPDNVRKHYFDVITNLRTDQVELLESFRQKINNDMNLIAGLHKVAVHYQVTPREATEQVLNFWRKYSKMNMPTAPDASIREGGLVLGRAPPLQINQLRGLSNTMVRFIGEHLVRMDETTSRQWTTSMPVLMELDGHGMFADWKVTQICPTGRAVVLLNKNLQISIYKLREILMNGKGTEEAKDCSNILKLIGKLPPAVASTDIPKDTKLLIDKYRLRLECRRRETLNWITTNANEKLLLILRSNLQNFEKDRLITFKSTVTTAKAMPYMENMMKFVSNMSPKNISEMVSYGEYVITCVETEKRNLEGELRGGRLQLPRNTNKATFLRERASEIVFRNTDTMRRNWDTTLNLVREKSMVGPASLESGLSDDALVTAIRSARIGFGSKASAACHVVKHPTNPPSAYVDRANETIRSATRWQATLAQDGDARLLHFEGPEGSVILLERNGSVLLCTFSPKTATP